MNLEIEIINRSENELPKYATEGSSGMDLRANNSQPVILKPMERCLIPTGLFIAIPDGCEGQVRPRSGLAVNKGITCLNSPGTIDSDYRGEIKVLLVNLGDEDQTIDRGERIAQIVFVNVLKPSLTVVQELNNTNRSSGGFGHTGTL